MILPSALTCPECRGERHVDRYRDNWGNLSATEEFTHVGTDPCETCSHALLPTGLIDVEVTSEGAWFEGDGPYSFGDLEHHLSVLLLDEGLIGWPSVVRILHAAESFGSWSSEFRQNGGEEN